ncbi:MAG: DUF483 domain-containing protein [Thermoplasmatota archaeon]
MLDYLRFQMDHHTADLKPSERPARDEAGEIVLDAVRRGRLSESRAVENLYMVAVGIRDASMFHPVDIDEILIVHDLAQKLKLGMVVRKCGNLVHKVFLFANEDRMPDIPDIYENVGFENFIIAQIAIARMSGEILDFPECCMKSFVGHLMQGTDQDRAATEALRKEPDPDPDAYFVERFVPCRPRCDRAISIGRKITSDLYRTDPQIASIYQKLKREHMKEVRIGSIVEEKQRRDGAVP